ncbi:hypothetical protein Mgra_00001813, partial [Meloidogyne graminicola]
MLLLEEEVVEGEDMFQHHQVVMLLLEEEVVAGEATLQHHQVVMLLLEAEVVEGEDMLRQEGVVQKAVVAGAAAVVEVVVDVGVVVVGAVILHLVANMQHLLDTLLPLLVHHIQQALAVIQAVEEEVEVIQVEKGTLVVTKVAEVIQVVE